MAPDPIWHQECERSQFGTGVNLAPDPIWHQGCKGVNLAPSSSFVSGDPYDPMRVEILFQWTFISNIRGLFGFVLWGRVKIINTGLFLPTVEEGTVCVVSRGPYGPNRGNKYSSIPDCYCQQHKGERKSYILDCFCQHLRGGGNLL